ncbi:MAG: DNA polymerase III subunit alpha [Alkalibacterium sp.]|nr:DNA polymerase III subunit alpha [Alkalibacterium sp.]
MNYIPLNVISAYSLLESTITIPKLLKQAENMGYQSIALTDKEVMYGSVEFYLKAKELGIKPILGITIDIFQDKDSDRGLSVVLLAKNARGYQDLLALSTLIKYEQESVTFSRLKTYADHLIAIVNQDSIKKWLETEDSVIKSVLENLKRTCSDTYVGLAFNGDNQEVVKKVSQIASDVSLPKVVSEPVKSLDEKDALSLNVLKAIKDQTTLEMEEEPAGQSFYSLQDKSAKIEWYKTHGLSDALENSVRIADSIDLQLSWESVLPQFATPEGMKSEDYLTKIVRSQLQSKLPDHTEEYEQRIEKELSVIIKMGFADYFLIVWDLMKYAHKKEIVTGAGRGSAAGSLVSFLLNITDVDPVAYDLLFDRFLNEARFTLPDIDLDFPDDKRDSILQYVLHKYGKEHVAQIATFGTFAAKMAVRDTGRVFGLTSAELKSWSDAIPSALGMTLKQAYKESEAFRTLVNESETSKSLFKTALNLEGLPRHVSTHAAGVVISRDPLVHTAPLQEGNGSMPLTQFTMNDVETVGLLKMDFLGLKNLSILADCLKNVPELKGSVKEKLDAISLDDPQTLELFRRGDTSGIFQFESRGIRNVLRKLQPSSFEDIVAVNALYRPGPMEQIDVYIERKKSD